MTYFAIGESDGGAGERRLGPFDTPDEAKSAGKRETKDSNGAFVFKGVVDEANNQVFVDVEPVVSTNAVVRNAIAANRRVARNADELDKMFGSVRALAFDDGGLGVRYVIDLGGFREFTNPISWNDAGKKCASEARSMASLFEKRASLLKQAATWLEQNAK